MLLDAVEVEECPKPCAAPEPACGKKRIDASFAAGKLLLAFAGKGSASSGSQKIDADEPLLFLKKGFKLGLSGGVLFLQTLNGDAVCEELVELFRMPLQGEAVQKWEAEHPPPRGLFFGSAGFNGANRWNPLEKCLALFGASKVGGYPVELPGLALEFFVNVGYRLIVV